MIIVKMASGLANQMYTYAAGYALARELNRELVLDISACANAPWGFCLDNFNIPLHRKVKYELPDLESRVFLNCESELENFPEATIAVRTSEERNSYPNSTRVIVYPGLVAAQELSQYKVIYLTGYFFDPGRYFAKYWGELAKLFTLRFDNKDVTEFKKMIDGKVSIGVHVRRGDMLIADWAVHMEDNYYRAAMELYKEMYPDCVFCIFSDDIEYTKEMFGYDEAIYYIHFEGFDEASLNELVCLAMCNHRVISNNSTFGRIADDLNYDKLRHIVYRDVNEASVGIDIERKKKEHQIWLNKYDIEMYSRRFVKKEKRVQEQERDALECFTYLVEKQQWHSVLQFAQEHYYRYQKQERFILGLYRSLMAIEALEEAKLELFNLPLENFKTYITGESREKQEELLRLYNKNIASRKKRYILVSNEKMHPASRLLGLMNWISPLAHLGNKVSIVYEPIDENANSYFNKEHLYSSRGIDLGCTHFEKNNILKEGVATFYNQIQEEELVIVSRDCRFFVTEGVNKNMTFITTDLSDREDAEIGSLHKRGIHLLHEMELAEYVMTMDERLKTVGNGFVYCEVSQKAGIEVYDKLYGYGYNSRIQDKTIGMIYSLLSIV